MLQEVADGCSTRSDNDVGVAVQLQKKRSVVKITHGLLTLRCEYQWPLSTQGPEAPGAEGP